MRALILCGPDDLQQMGSESEDPVHAIKLADFTYRVIGPVGWQQKIENADWSSLATLPWIGTPETSVHHRLLSKVYDDVDDRPDVVACVDQEASMLEMVRSGIGLSLCRDSIALHQKQSFGLAVCDAVSVPACALLLWIAEKTARYSRNCSTFWKDHGELQAKCHRKTRKYCAERSPAISDRIYILDRTPSVICRGSSPRGPRSMSPAIAPLS